MEVVDYERPFARLHAGRNWAKLTICGNRGQMEPETIQERVTRRFFLVS